MFSNGRGFVLVMLFLAGVINYLDRSALSVAAPFIQEDLHISPAQMGMLFSSFFIGYAIFNFIGGWASDKYGAKHTLSAAMVVCRCSAGPLRLRTTLCRSLSSASSSAWEKVLFQQLRARRSTIGSRKKKGRGRSEWPCAERRSEGRCQGRSSG
ncbi:hexuronate transporter [Bacillus glycinifermentans]|nr:hexuronate transporter [Bacillus glycinifermentans]